MKERLRGSAQRRVVEEYFATTTGGSAPTDALAFVRARLALRRRLGSWLDVAGKDVVDLGSGIGVGCALACEGGARSVIGVNLSLEENAFAQERVAATFIRADIVDFMAGCEDASLDRIFALNVLEHLELDDVVLILEHAFRCLRNGGEFIAMVPNATSPVVGAVRYGDVTHRNAFTPSSVLQLSRLVGFGDRTEFRECGPIPHGIFSVVRFTLWRGIRWLIWSYYIIETASGKGGIYTADMLFRLRKANCDASTGNT